MVASQPDEAEIFNSARRIGDRGARADFLRQACGLDEGLFRRIEELLVIHDSPDRLLDQAAVQTPAGDDTWTGEWAKTVDGLRFLSPSDRPGAIGRLGHYDVLAEVGRGGMGIVLRAFDRNLQRVVAIKVLAPHLAVSPTAVKRFVREARAAAAIRNEHVIDLHAVEEENGLPFFVMEYISGISLQERLDRSGPLGLPDVVRIALQTARGLAAAHAVGMIHRDVKPANILLENDAERVKLTDFGLARAADDASLTQAGMIIGTPTYMSPEQARGEPIDARSDLFSFGSVIHAMCTGHAPFRADTSMAVLKRICEETPPDPRDTNSAVPTWLVALIEKLHAKDPGARFQSAAEVADLLAPRLVALEEGRPLPDEAIAQKRTSARTRRVRTGHAIVAALALGLGLTITCYAPTVYRFATNKGELVIETDDPDIEVTVKKDNEVVQIVDKKSGRTVTLKAGRYQVELGEGANGLTLSTDQFTLERGGKAVVKVSVGPPAIRELLRFEEITAIPWAAAFCLGDRCVVGGAGTKPVGLNWVPGDDTDIRVWDAKTGKVLRRLKGYTDGVACVAVSPNGKVGVSGGLMTEGGIFVARVWDLESGKELRQFTKHTGRIMAAAFLPNGRQVVTVGGYEADKKPEGEVRLWDVETCEEIRRFKGHHHEVKWMAISPDGKRMLTSGQDGCTILWDVEKGTIIRQTERATAPSQSGPWFAIARDCRRAVLACWDRSILVFDVESGDPIRRLTGHTDTLGLPAITPDGRHVVSCGDTTVRLWDVDSGREISRLEGFQVSFGVKAISADGKEVLLQTFEPTLRLLRLPLPDKKR